MFQEIYISACLLLLFSPCTRNLDPSELSSDQHDVFAVRIAKEHNSQVVADPDGWAADVLDWVGTSGGGLLIAGYAGYYADHTDYHKKVTYNK